MISSLKIDGRLTSDFGEIGKHVVRFYLDLFSSSTSGLQSLDDDLLSEVFIYPVNIDDNVMLTAILSRMRSGMLFFLWIF